MGSAHSNSIYAGVLRCIFDDLQSLSGIDLSTDRAYFLSRYEEEGLSFLTKTLPTIDKSILAWLGERESEPPTCGELFRPAILRRYLDLMFQTGDLGLRACLLRGIRQLSCLFYKIELPLEDDAVRFAADEFIERDRSLVYVEIPHHEAWFEQARLLVWRLLKARPLTEYMCEHKPKHGPGAVASGEKGPKKWNFRRFFYDWPYFFDTDAQFHKGQYSPLSESDPPLVADPLPCSELVAVPKDSRGPRLICKEPLEMQYLQQWFLQIFDAVFERSIFRNELSMRDQTRNQALAIAGSKNQEWATLDLKDASDRVCLPLVSSLLPWEWWENLRRLRSSHVQIFDKRYRLEKFAPMGSAICFPIEELVFWAIARAVSANTLGTRLHAEGLVSVFGDDIIVRRECADPVVAALESVGLKVNRQKSFVNGRFRESCGVDAYNGIVVTPARVKHSFPSKWNDCEGLPNWVAVHNHLDEWCFDSTAEYVREELLKIAPLLCDGHAGLTLRGVKPTRLRMQRSRNVRHVNYQRPETYTYVHTSPAVPFGEGTARLRRSIVSPVVDGVDPNTFREQHTTVAHKKWIRTT